jgi:hypothetical protein
MNLGDPLDELTTNVFRQSFRLLSRELEDPELDSDLDKWHLRITVVLLAAALEGRDVDVLGRSYGLPEGFY